MYHHKKIRIGARSSPLSLAQVNELVTPLKKTFPDVLFELTKLDTEGDRNKNSPLESLGRGTFIKEIESALIDGRIDLAIHSAKDIPIDLPTGVVVMGTVPRQDPRDVLVDRWSLPLDELPKNARIGTSSPRRTAQIKERRPDIQFFPIRGNIGTRLTKSKGPDYDGIILAAAGLARLGKLDEVAEYLPLKLSIPDVGQGILAVEFREEDTHVREMINRISHTPTTIALRAERSFLAKLGGGCNLPVAAYANVTNRVVEISSMAALPDGSCIYRANGKWPSIDPEAAGSKMAKHLLKAGAADIL